MSDNAAGKRPGGCVAKALARWFTWIALVLAFAIPVSAATTASAAASPGGPVMGYNPYYWSPGGVTEAQVLAQARLLVSTGLAKAGYGYVNLDDGWMAPARTATGALTWNTADFPDGIPGLAQQVHALGLKFGLYTSIGSITCQHLPGSAGHYAQDAQTFASWGVDFVKVDECGVMPPTETARATAFQQFGTALKTDNPGVVYSEELPVAYTPGSATWVAAIRASASFANMWRMTPDERPTASPVAAAIDSHPTAGAVQAAATPASTILSHLADDLHLHGFAGPDHWNDLDMLTGASALFGWTLTQQETQLSVWAEEASPLILSANVATLTGAELSALKNPYLIAIDQSGKQAPTARTNGTLEALIKPYPGGGWAVMVVNTGTGRSGGKFTLAALGIPGHTVTVYNIWTAARSHVTSLAYTLAAGRAILLRVTSP